MLHPVPHPAPRPPGLSSSAQELSSLRHLLPRPDFSPASAAALLDSTPDQATLAIRQLLIAGELALSMPDSPALARYHALGAWSPTTVRPQGPREHQALQRLFAHLLQQVGAIEHQLAPDQDPPQVSGEPPCFCCDRAAVRWFRAERAGLITTQQWAFALGDYTLARQLAEGMWTALRLLRQHEDLLAVCRMAADAADRDGHADAGLPWARTAWVLNDTDRVPEAIEAGTRALELARQHDHAAAMVAAHTELGRSRRNLGQLESALSHLQAAGGLCRRPCPSGPDGGSAIPATAAARVWTELARTRIDLGHIGAAVTAARTAVTGLSTASRRQRVEAHLVLAHALIIDRQPDEAIPVLAELVDSADPDLHQSARLLHLLGVATMGTGDHNAAWRHYRHAIALFEATQDPEAAQEIQAVLGMQPTETAGIRTAAGRESAPCGIGPVPDDPAARS